MRLATIFIVLSLSTTHLCAQVFQGQMTDTPIQENANFGFAVDNDGDWLAISSSFWDDQSDIPSPLVNIGAVSLYKRNASEWVFHTRIIPELPFREVNSQFGKGLSIAQGVLVIGQANASNDQNARSGRVHIYQLDAGGHENWGLVQTLTPPAPQTGARFGFAIDNIDDLIIIGEYRYNHDGRVHVYKLNPTQNQWALDTTLNPIESCHIGASRFGWSVAVDRMPNGELAMIVGDSRASYVATCHSSSDVVFIDTGSVHFFGTNKGVWGEVNVISNIGVGAQIFLDFGHLGHSVDIDMSTGYAIAGAPDQRIPRDTGTVIVGDPHGQVLFFRFDAEIEQWAIVRQIAPYSGTDAVRQFGAGVELDGDSAIVSAAASERVLMYSRHAGGFDSWGESSRLNLLPFTSGDGVAHVSIVKDQPEGSPPAQFVITSPNNDPQLDQVNAGSILIFDTMYSQCPADINRDSVLDVQDLLTLISSYAMEDTTADWDNNGIVNFFDISAFIADWHNGCL